MATRPLPRIVRRVGNAVVALTAALLLTLLAFRLAAVIREDDAQAPPSLTLVSTTLGQVATDQRGRGPTVLLVHGSAGWSGFWTRVSAHLAACGWRVVAVDLPPFGYSERPAGARYDRASQARRLAEVIAATGGRAVVVGHSFGGGPAAELALRHPAHVRALVLVDAALGDLDRAQAGPGVLARAMRSRAAAELAVATTVTNPLLTGALLRPMLARKAAADRWVPTIQRPMRRPGTTAAYAAWLPTLLEPDRTALSARAATLAHMPVPTHLIWGEADTVTPLGQGTRIAALTRARSFARLPGVGHIPHIEDERGFLAALDRAISGYEGE